MLTVTPDCDPDAPSSAAASPLGAARSVRYIRLFIDDDAQVLGEADAVVLRTSGRHAHHETLQEKNKGYTAQNAWVQCTRRIVGRRELPCCAAVAVLPT